MSTWWYFGVLSFSPPSGESVILCAEVMVCNRRYDSAGWLLSFRTHPSRRDTRYANFAVRYLNEGRAVGVGGWGPLTAFGVVLLPSVWPYARSWKPPLLHSASRRFIFELFPNSRKQLGGSEV